jgi:hypothetical protein
MNIKYGMILFFLLVVFQHSKANNLIIKGDLFYLNDQHFEMLGLRTPRFFLSVRPDICFSFEQINEFKGILEK